MLDFTSSWLLVHFRRSWEKSRGKVAPTVWLWDSRECRLKPEGLEIAIIRFDHMAEEQHWNSELEALNHESLQWWWWWISPLMFLYSILNINKTKKNTSAKFDQISIDFTQWITVVYLPSISILNFEIVRINDIKKNQNTCVLIENRTMCVFSHGSEP